MLPSTILIFDVGKTNKKALLFDEEYHTLWEESVQLNEVKDEDGFPCEDVNALSAWIRQKFSEATRRQDILVKAVNFSAYGASLVHLDKAGAIAAPLYNYLKPYPESLQNQFYESYGGCQLVSRQTASPVLGSLNSGMQLYRLKYERPSTFERISYSLHLPQYLAFVLSKKTSTDISSIGCHTNLWDFASNGYHRWVYKEGVNTKLATLYKADTIISVPGSGIGAGIGLHDSSAALVPYLFSFQAPFALLSTGTWNITLNPFNSSPLSDAELNQDCLCYLSYDGSPVKASRLFAGFEHEQQVKRLASHFTSSIERYKTVQYDGIQNSRLPNEEPARASFSELDLGGFNSYAEAYHRLIAEIVQKQAKATRLVLGNSGVKKIFVDGGFSKNVVFMNMLAQAFSYLDVYAAVMPQASSLGAALAIRGYWNKNSVPHNLVTLEKYSNTIINQ